jgi:DNA-binding LacI/PurR family transcriptional regulator
VQMLLAAMEGDSSVRRRVVIAPELRERGSTTPPGA